MLKVISVTERFDIEGFRKVFDNPETARNTASFVCPFTRDLAQERYQKMLGDMRKHPLACENLIWADDVVVGTIGVFLNEDRHLEVGYVVHPDHGGKGIASRALMVILDRLKVGGFKGQLQAGYAKDNPASGRVLEKAGFGITGEGAFYSKGAGEDRPCWRMSLNI